MKNIKNKFLIIMLTIMSQSLLADSPLRIKNMGLDGNQRIYLVYCPDGSKSSISYRFKFEPKTSVVKTCVTPKISERICRDEKWPLQEAAEFGCK